MNTKNHTKAEKCQNKHVFNRFRESRNKVVFSPGNCLHCPKPVTAGFSGLAFWPSGMEPLHSKENSEVAGAGRQAALPKVLIAEVSSLFPSEESLVWCFLMDLADLKSVVLTTTSLLPRVKCLVGRREYLGNRFYSMVHSRFRLVSELTWRDLVAKYPCVFMKEVIIHTMNKPQPEGPFPCACVGMEHRSSSNRWQSRLKHAYNWENTCKRNIFEEKHEDKSAIYIRKFNNKGLVLHVLHAFCR